MKNLSCECMTPKRFERWGEGARAFHSEGEASATWRPESAGVVGVGEPDVCAEPEEVGGVGEGGARLSRVGRAAPPGSDTRFIASICSLFSPMRLFA